MQFSVLEVLPSTPQFYIDQIIELIWKEWGSHYQSFEYLESEVKSSGKADSPTVVLYVLDNINNTVCGTMSLLANDLPIYPEFNPWLANFLVLPEYRNQGIGRMLYKAIMDHAINRFKYKELYLYTLNPEPYTAKGWEIIEPFYYQKETQFLLKFEVVDSQEYNKSN